MQSLRRPNPSDDVGARLDRLPVFRFHLVLLGIAAASLLFDGLDGVVMTFVLSNLRTVWQIDVATIGVVSAIGFGGTSWARRRAGSSRTGSGARRPCC